MKPKQGARISKVLYLGNRAILPEYYDIVQSRLFSTLNTTLMSPSCKTICIGAIIYERLSGPYAVFAAPVWQSVPTAVINLIHKAPVGFLLG